MAGVRAIRFGPAWGTGGSAGKFVVLRRGNELHLALSPAGLDAYHAQIARRYLEGYGVEVDMHGSTGCRIADPAWRIRGGGHYAADPVARMLRCSGKSTAFGKYEAAALAGREAEILVALGLADWGLELA